MAKRSRPAKSRHRNQPDDQKPSVDDGAQVEGRQAVRELLIAGRRPVKEVLIAEEQDSSDVLGDIKELARMNGVLVKDVTRKRLKAEAVTTVPQGVVARARPIQFSSLEELASDPEAFLVVLDGVTDPQNFGAILRVAECAGVTGVVIAERRSVRVTPTATKAAAGALEHVKICRVGGVPSAISDLQNAGVFTAGLDAAGDVDLFASDAPIERPIALVMGREGSGLSKLVRQRVDKLLSIPLIGELNSLNVSTATAVACFEVVRRTKKV